MEDMLLKDRVLSLITPPLKYDSYGQMIFDQNDHLVANVRSWGMFQYEENGEQLQDTLGEMLVTAFNEKYQSGKNHE